VTQGLSAAFALAAVIGWYLAPLGLWAPLVGVLIGMAMGHAAVRWGRP
jgi:hypothetical protein